jgi:integrase
MMMTFKSGFAGKLNAFLDWRVARGYKRETYMHSLIKFDRFCEEQAPDLIGLTQQIVHLWLDNITVTLCGIESAALAIRQFGKYLNAIDETAYILPDKYAPIKTGFVPYKFTDSELAALFSAVDALPDDRNEPYLSEIAPTLFRLIYTCGLRPNEGRELLCDNVNLETGEILIMRTKRHKDRIVVMSDDMLEHVRRYNLRRSILADGSPYFFPASSGGAFTSSKLLGILNKAWATATCTPQSPVPRKIRIYDLRHRFASARLNLWLDAGENLMVMLPYLSQYMGHETLSETAYYVHILPENLMKSPAIDWDKLNAMLPEVTK